MDLSIQAVRSAKSFIEKEIENIEKENWEAFFYNMWRLYGSTSTAVIDLLRECDISWDESKRLAELLIGIEETVKDQITDEIYIRDLYRTTSPAFSPKSWLGYTEDEFYELVILNASKLLSCRVNGGKIGERY